MASLTTHTLRLTLWGLVSVAIAAAVLRPDLVERLRGPAEAIDPCTTTLAWHIRDVDPRFDIPAHRVREAVETAAGVWEAAGGRDFFRRDTVGSMAIDLVYDDRQRAREERVLRESDLEALAEEARSLEAVLGRMEARAERTREAYQRSPTPRTEAAYRGALDRYNGAVAHYNAVAERYNRAVDRLKASGGEPVQAGNLHTSVRTVNGRVVSVDRVLTVALVGGYEELVTVLTHELGHALGIDHVPVDGALMAATYRDDDVALPITLHPADVRALARVCRLE